MIAFLARLVGVLILGWLLAVGSVHAQTFPALTGRVVDEAQLLSRAREAELTAKLEALERDTTDQLVVVTVKDLQGYEIEDYGVRLARHWAIGQKTGDNGVLLIVAAEERKVRIEVGYGLEPVLTDAFSALVIHNRILPAFRAGGFERGIADGVAAIDEHLRLDPAEAQARAAAMTVKPARAARPVIPALIIIVVFFFVFMALMGHITRGRRRRGRDGLSPILIWMASEALRSGSSGGGGRRGGGGFGGGGFGGGGFSGGGGSFGGGGASGGW